jgi:hypothetical protein
MPQDPWQTAFDRLGLAVYYTIVTGQIPDSEMLSHAARTAEEEEPEEPVAIEVPAPKAEPLATAA